MIFEDNSTAVLYQNESEALRIPLDSEVALTDLLTTYYHHRRPDIDGFENAMAAFQAKIPDIAATLANKVSSARSNRRQFAAVFDNFLSLCRGSLNPALSPEQVRDARQHLLTSALSAALRFDESFLQDIARSRTGLTASLPGISRKTFLAI